MCSLLNINKFDILQTLFGTNLKKIYYETNKDCEKQTSVNVQAADWNFSVQITLFNF